MPPKTKLQTTPTLIGKCYILAQWAVRQAGSATNLRHHFAEIAEELKELAPEECGDDEADAER